MKYPPYIPNAALQVNDGNALSDWFGAQNPTGDLLDVNVWFALADPEHKHHKPALAYWSAIQATKTPVWFCRVTMLGMVRLLAQQAAMGERRLSLQDAHAVYESYLQLPFVHWFPETNSLAKKVDAKLASIVQGLPVRMSTDAYLGAMALSTGLRMVTFDADFKRFELENWLLLSA
jgi:uncharacterized protein